MRGESALKPLVANYAIVRTWFKLTCSPELKPFKWLHEFACCTRSWKRIMYRIGLLFHFDETSSYHIQLKKRPMKGMRVIPFPWGSKCSLCNSLLQHQPASVWKQEGAQNEVLVLGFP